ncbi:MAG: hypothetical protein IT306_14575, partial [Chloroflexi bacterium]|nr:hypothetical protein [Chloroflexota bacterium]
GLSTRASQAANGDAVLAGQSVSATAPTRISNTVSLTPDSTADGVQGYATGANNAGLFGRNNTTDGIGVSGAAPSGTGVFGESSNGFGVGGKSDAKYGVYGKSNSAEGVYAESTSSTAVRGVSTSGVGGSFAGGLSAIRLVPAASGTGAPTAGAHLQGELYVDSAGTLFYCTTAGTPGTWQQVALGSGGGGGMTNPMTTQNDLIIGGTSGAPARLAKGSNGQILTVNGSGNVAWATPSGGGGGAPIIKTISASASFTLSANSTWEDLKAENLTDPLQVSVTLSATSELLCLATVLVRGASANWLSLGFRFSLDGTTYSPVMGEGMSANANQTYIYMQTLHAVFSGVTSGSHQIRLQSSDQTSSLDRAFTMRQLTVLVGSA